MRSVLGEMRVIANWHQNSEYRRLEIPASYTFLPIKYPRSQLRCAISRLRLFVFTLFSILKLVPNVVELFAQNSEFFIR